MKWIYKKEVNRMGEVTQTLTNESIDMPILDKYETPKLIIKKDRFGFGIKFCLGGLKLKGGYDVETYYTRGCYNTYVEHQRLVDRGIRKYRFRLDENEPQESNIDYFCKNESEFKIVGDFMFSLKESKRLIVELDTSKHGLLYYEFELDGLTELCDEHKIFQYKKPTPFEPYIPTTKGSSINGWVIVLILFSISLLILLFSNRSQDETQTTYNDESLIRLDTATYPVDWDDLSTIKKTETKRITKKVKETPIENNEEEEIIYGYKNEEPNMTESEKNMVKYLKERFPKYSDEEILNIVRKSNNKYDNVQDENIPTYTVSSVRHRVQEVDNEEVSYPTSYNYTNNEEPKKKGFIKRLFGKKNKFGDIN